MLLEINAKEIADAVALAAKIAGKKTGVMATSLMQIEAKESSLIVKATNYDVSLVANVDCSISKPGILVVEAVKLSALLKTYKNLPITLASKSGKLVISYEKSKHQLATVPVENFPKFEDIVG